MHRERCLCTHIVTVACNFWQHKTQRPSLCALGVQAHLFKVVQNPWTQHPSDSCLQQRRDPPSAVK